LRRRGRRAAVDAWRAASRAALRCPAWNFDRDVIRLVAAASEDQREPIPDHQ
jgi:hypothetical protein